MVRIFARAANLEAVKKLAQKHKAAAAAAKAAAAASGAAVASPPQRTTTKTLLKNALDSLQDRTQLRGGNKAARKRLSSPPSAKLSEPVYLDDAIENTNDELQNEQTGYDENYDDDDVDGNVVSVDDDDDDGDDDDDDIDNDGGDGGGGNRSNKGGSRLGFASSDKGTIHPFGPHVDPKVLLSSLTHTNGGGQQPIDDDGNDAGDVDDFDANSKSKLLSIYARTRNSTTADNGGVGGSGGGDVTLRPGAPRDLVAQIVNPRFVALSWMEPATNAEEVTSYTVYYRMTTSER